MGLTAVPDGGQLDREMTCSDYVDTGWLSGAHTTIIHRQQHSRPPSAKPLASPCNTSIEGGFGAGTEKVDCTKTALSIIEQLETSKNVSLAGVTQASDGNKRSLTATEACQQLLTILMCPCSEQADVALLVASGCLSLLDVVHESVGTSPDAGSVAFECSVGGDGTSVSPGCSDQEVFIWASRPRSSSRSSFGSHGVSQVGDLSKVAKVILQFTERYCRYNKGGAQWEHTAWVIGPVAALLRCRLQSVTQGAARRIVL
ncbi:hypothetical protein K4F52_002131 [Lecanicillium sp. MT-2017a]|nr:hypothetical protein K4F52_002131 [Lecanicillium sp. MT-2017a]